MTDAISSGINIAQQKVKTQDLTGPSEHPVYKRPFVNYTGLANYLKSRGIDLKESTLRKCKLQIPRAKFGKEIVFDLDKIDAWIDSAFAIDAELVVAPKRPAKAKDPKPPPSNLDSINIGEVYEGRIKVGKHTFLTKKSFDEMTQRLTDEEFELCVVELDSWVDKAEPLPGEKPNKEYQDRKRKAWNGAASFNTWVIGKIQKETRAGDQSRAIAFDPDRIYNS